MTDMAAPPEERVMKRESAPAPTSSGLSNVWVVRSLLDAVKLCVTPLIEEDTELGKDLLFTHAQYEQLLDELEVRAASAVLRLDDGDEVVDGQDG